jgi:hypothetical protein
MKEKPTNKTINHTYEWQQLDTKVKKARSSYNRAADQNTPSV